MSQRTPDLMPVLSRGKHRSPRKGACFMELASYLAGERWSDHPKCTHPLLAALAREVNDHVGDDARTRLAPMIPDVVGLTGDDRRVAAWIARDAALAALPVVAANKQGVAAVGLLSCERYLNHLEGRDEWHVSDVTTAALNEVPQARDWALRFPVAARRSPEQFPHRSAPVVVHTSVSGIAGACVSDSDTLLVDLLEQTIRRCQVWFGRSTDRAAPAWGDDRWQEAVALTRR
jgi:hypothetical protein